jgi:DNA repair exonuclease SbcCD ATPase subunit
VLETRQKEMELSLDDLMKERATLGQSLKGQILELKNYENRIDLLEFELGSKEEVHSNLRSQISDLSLSLERMEQENIRLGNDCAEMNNVRQTFSQEIEKWRKERQEEMLTHEADARILQENVAKVVEERDTLAMKVSSIEALLNETTRDNSLLKSRIENLEDMVEIKSDEISSLLSQLGRNQRHDALVSFPGIIPDVTESLESQNEMNEQRDSEVLVHELASVDALLEDSLRANDSLETKIGKLEEFVLVQRGNHTSLVSESGLTKSTPTGKFRTGVDGGTELCRAKSADQDTGLQLERVRTILNVRRSNLFETLRELRASVDFVRTHFAVVLSQHLAIRNAFMEKMRSLQPGVVIPYLQESLVQFFSQDRSAQDRLVPVILGVVGCSEAQINHATDCWRARSGLLHRLGL